MSTTYTINQVIGYTGEGDTQEPVVKTHHVTLDELADLLEDGRAAEALVENGRLGEHDVWTVATDAKSRDCTNGNHSVCSVSSCSCSCHKSSPQKDYSGACADGDHDVCKMTPGTGSDECACPHHGKISSRRTVHGPYGKTWDIVGYLYQADLYTPEGVIEAMIADGLASPAARDMPVENALDQIAEANAIDRMIEYSFDSDEFPKAVFRDQDEGSYYLDANGDYVTLYEGDEWAVVGMEVAP